MSRRRLFPAPSVRRYLQSQPPLTSSKPSMLRAPLHSRIYIFLSLLFFSFLYYHFLRNPLSLPSPSPLSSSTFTSTDSTLTSSSKSLNSPAPPEAEIAYFLQIANNTVEHFPRLLRRLHHPSNIYAIHFDLKIPSARLEPLIKLISTTPAYSNVHIMPSELITYRGVSMLLNTINAISFLLSTSTTWDYFINLSGSDYPLLTPTTIRQLLAPDKNLTFFTFAPRSTWDNMAEHRIGAVWYDEALTFRGNASEGSLRRLNVRNPLVDERQFEMAHAEAWLIGARDFCEEVVTGDYARKLLVAFGVAVDSSEHFFASLAWNLKDWKRTIVPHSLRHIVWHFEGKKSGQHPYYVDEKLENGEWKFKELLDGSVLFFARKFKQADSELMDFLDQRAELQDTITRADEHIRGKVKSRELRVSEL